MNTDPKLLPTTPEARAAEQRVGLQRSVESASKAPRVQPGAGAPTEEVRNGAMYVDETSSRLYVRCGNVWRYVQLT